jgi:hypothetical protein
VELTKSDVTGVSHTEVEASPPLVVCCVYRCPPLLAWCGYLRNSRSGDRLVCRGTGAGVPSHEACPLPILLLMSDRIHTNKLQLRVEVNGEVHHCIRSWFLPKDRAGGGGEGLMWERPEKGTTVGTRHTVHVWLVTLLIRCTEVTC